MTNTKFLLITSISLLLSGNFQAEAAVRSIVDVGKSEFGLNFANVDTGLKTDTLCTDTGYTLTSCESNHVPDETSRCPNNPKYFKYCLCDTSFYDITLNGNETIESICGKLATTQGCTDKKGSHYTCSCANDSLTLCNAENEYPLTIKAGYFCRRGRNENPSWIQKNSCKSCEAPLVVNASKTGCSCPAEYKECNLGPEVGANSCTENGITKYDNCKDCANRGTYTTCPTGYACSLEDCSKKYYITGCATGYVNLDTCSWKCMFTRIMPKN